MSSVISRAELIRGVAELIDEVTAAGALGTGSPSGRRLAELRRARDRAVGAWVDQLGSARRRRLEAAVALLTLPSPDTDPASPTSVLEESHAC